MRTTNNFLVVPRIIFNTSIENYFFIVLIIIFRGIANLFLGLQCFANLAVKVDWFQSLTSFSDHLKNFEVSGGVLSRDCQSETLSGKETKEVFIFLRKSAYVSDEVFWTEDLIVETTKRLHDWYTILILTEHDMSAQLNSSLPNLRPRVFVPFYTCWLSERRCSEWKCPLPRALGRISWF